MDTPLTTTIVSTSGAVITGIFGMFFTANSWTAGRDDFSNHNANSRNSRDHCSRRFSAARLRQRDLWV
jgi:hypothetical protein